jgi:hypothetical protein
VDHIIDAISSDNAASPDFAALPIPASYRAVVGRWAADTVTVADAGEVRVAVLGEHTVEEDVLRRETERSTDLATLLRDRAGSFHVVTANHPVDHHTVLMAVPAA